MKRRIDQLLVERRITESRHKAQALLLAGRILVNEQKIEKPGQQVDAEAAIRVLHQIQFASRAGGKLQGALDHFQISVAGRVCADLGASTGGFTDCLLQRGASRIYAFDVGHAQMDWKLRSDPRIVIRDGFNVRNLRPADLPADISFICIDLSFISVTKILLPLRDSLVRSQKSEVRSQESEVRSQESEVSLESGIWNLESGISNQESGVRSQKSEVRNQDSGIRNPESDGGQSDGTNAEISIDIVVLVKPQFEVGKGEVGKGGIVREPAKRLRALEAVSEYARQAGFVVAGSIPSPVAGAEGNQEFLLYLQLAKGL
jgi:TlyA family rRNA methyltransferase/putative hemolysin